MSMGAGGASGSGVDVPGEIRGMDPMNLWQPLVLRFGEQAVEYWIKLLTTVQPLLLGSLTATSRAKGEPVMPDAVLLVLRFPSDDPEGEVGTVGWTLFGPVDPGMKQAVLTRALEQFVTHGDMFPQGGGWEKPPAASVPVSVGSGEAATLSEATTLTGIRAVVDEDPDDPAEVAGNHVESEPPLPPDVGNRIEEERPLPDDVGNYLRR